MQILFKSKHLFTKNFMCIYVFKLLILVKVCPHAGGVGLCEMVQHLQMWDYISLSATKQDRYVEFIDQQHEQFIHPAIVENAHYMAPEVNMP